jgi:hypothetical protein
VFEGTILAFTWKNFEKSRKIAVRIIKYETYPESEDTKSRKYL